MCLRSGVAPAQPDGATCAHGSPWEPSFSRLFPFPSSFQVSRFRTGMCGCYELRMRLIANSLAHPARIKQFDEDGFCCSRPLPFAWTFRKSPSACCEPVLLGLRILHIWALLPLSASEDHLFPMLATSTLEIRQKVLGASGSSESASNWVLCLCAYPRVLVENGHPSCSLSGPGQCSGAGRAAGCVLSARSRAHLTPPGTEEFIVNSGVFRICKCFAQSE